jgi:hypothetical protein
LFKTSENSSSDFNQKTVEIETTEEQEEEPEQKPEQKPEEKLKQRHLK